MFNLLQKEKVDSSQAQLKERVQFQLDHLELQDPAIKM